MKILIFNVEVFKLKDKEEKNLCHPDGVALEEEEDPPWLLLLRPLSGWMKSVSSCVG